MYAQFRDEPSNASAVAQDSIVLDTATPVMCAPSHGLAAGSRLGAGTAPVVISWPAAADAGSGVARYELQQKMDAGAWTDVQPPTAPARSIARPLAPGTYQFRVRAIDRAERASVWRQGSSFAVATHQETSAAVTYAGAWGTSANKAYSDGSARRAAVAGSRAAFAFTGDRVAWIAARSASRGKAEVWLDGARVATVDLYSPALKPRAAVFARAVATGAHKLEVRVLGQKRAEATDTVVDVDAFVVLR